MNEFLSLTKSYSRQHDHAEVFGLIQSKIEELFQPYSITYPEEAEMLESLVRLTESKNILEIGMHTGFASLHLVRAIYGNGMVTSIDQKAQHDVAWFEQPQIAKHFKFVEGKTPDVLSSLHDQIFDFVFVDSDHSPEHTSREIDALIPLTRRGTMFVFHDIPRIQRLGDIQDCPIRVYINSLLNSVGWKGMILPSPYRIDCARAFGDNYDRDLNPHLAVLVRDY